MSRRCGRCGKDYEPAKLMPIIRLAQMIWLGYEICQKCDDELREAKKMACEAPSGAIKLDG